MRSTRTRTRRRAPPVSEAGLRTLYDHSPVGIAELSAEGRFLRANEALQRLLGRSESELRRLTFQEVTHPDDLSGCVKDFGCLVAGEIDHFEMEKRFLRKDGAFVWSHTIVTAVRSGRAVAMIGMAIDISERRKAQEELSRLKNELEVRVRERTAALSFQAAQLAAQLESSPDAILVVDAQGRIVSRNKRFGELWRIPEAVLTTGSDEEALESVLALLVDPGGFLERVRHLYRHREEKSFDELRLRDGRVFERYSSPVTGSDGRYFGRVWHFQDVTERARHDAEIREKNEALARSNAELEMYAYAASHDLSAPLRKIIAFGELLMYRARAKLDAADLDYIERMRKAAAAALKLVTDMLTLSRIGRDPLPLAEVDLNTVLEEAKAELAGELEDVRIEAGPLPVLSAHASLLHALLTNLLSNSAKFRSPDRPLLVRIDLRAEGDQLLLTVADNGIGFDRVYADKIFEPFLRLHAASDFAGSGIGLAICRRVATRYGGTIAAEGEPGKGATFTVRLPAAMLVR